MRRALLLVALTATPRLAFAHGGNPAQAVVVEPMHLGPTYSDTFLVKWLDAGPPPPVTGSAMVNLFYSSQIPHAFPLGIIPLTVTGTAIVRNLLEEIEPNELAWDVSNVPSGHYWIWSRVDDPPAEMSPQYIRYSPAPVTVLHPGDVIGPAIALLKPQSEFSTADEFYTIDYESWDPTGTARIRFEASPDAFRREPMWFVIADNIQAQPKATIGWNTSVLDEGDYMLRATITDCNGRSFVGHSRYFVFVAHLDVPDAGPFEIGAPPDGGSLEEWCSELPGDSGVLVEAGVTADVGSSVNDGGGMIMPEESCGCRTTTDRSAPTFLWLALFFFLRRTSSKVSLRSR